MERPTFKGNKIAKRRNTKTVRGTTFPTKSNSNNLNLLNCIPDSNDSNQNDINSLNTSMEQSSDGFCSQASSNISMNDPEVKNAYISFLDSQESMINNVGESINDSVIDNNTTFSSNQEEQFHRNQTENETNSSMDTSQNINQDIVEQPLGPLTRGKKLQLLLESRNVGVYVYCDNCNKIRYLDDVKDPTELPDLWYCKDNPDETKNTCEAPEMKILEEVNNSLIENRFNAGSLVWAKYGKQWWPGMVVDCPEYRQYFWIRNPNKMKPNAYHVQFFNNPSSSSSKGVWLKNQSIVPFKQGNPADNHKKKIPNYLKNCLQESIMIAESAAKVSLIERLKNFCSVYVDVNMSLIV